MAAEATSRELATIGEDESLEETRTDRARPIPRISIQAFCEGPGTAESVQVAADDRRLAKAHVSVHMGGIEAAVAHYQESPTPNLIIIESSLPSSRMLAELDRLAESCDAGTKVVVVGVANDVLLYRELLKRGVAEYLISPISPMQMMESISGLYNDPNADPVGHIYAFLGAKGGIGSSTVCHNVSWCLSEMLKASVVIADLDLAFGTAGLDFNQDPVQGIAEALGSPERLDEVLLDRLLTKCSEHLSIFAAPGMLDRDYDLTADSCDIVLDVVRQNVPYVTVDLPHVWTSWSKRVITQADEIIITATPDLASLRNTKNLIDLLKQTRQNDRTAHIVINMQGVPKRPEIPIKDFETALDMKACAVIEFDAETFGQAANNGQMIEEMSPKAKAVPRFRDIALAVSGRREHRPEKKSSLMPILERFKLKR
ncbi:MAG: CpaE family protein [Hyphomicrobiaceae bacterium]